MRRLDEKYIIDSPDKKLWVTGTSQQRYNVEKQKFNQIKKSKTKDQEGNEKEIKEVVLGMASPCNPIFFTNGLMLSMKYAQSHVSGDFADDKNSSAAYKEAWSTGKGLIVFAKLKDGTELFDFRDSECFTKAGLPGEAQQLFKDAEPYFAFNLSVRNEAKDQIPIVFVIAQKMFVYVYSKKNKYKDDKSVVLTFFNSDRNNGFIDILNSMNSVDFQLGSDWESKYSEFIQFYNETLGTTKTSISARGKNQLKRVKSTGTEEIVKELPNQITEEQRDLINLYFKMFDVYAKNKNIIPNNEFQKLRDNINPDKRIGYIDLLQACLYTMMKKAKYPGFYCPEYIGGDSLPTIAIFDESVIQKMKAYNASDIKQIVDNNPGASQSELISLVRSKLAHKHREQRLHRDQLNTIKSDKNYIWMKNGQVDETLAKDVFKIRDCLEDNSFGITFSLDLCDKILRKYNSSNDKDLFTKICYFLSGKANIFLGATKLSKTGHRIIRFVISNTKQHALDQFMIYVLQFGANFTAVQPSDVNSSQIYDSYNDKPIKDIFIKNIDNIDVI